MNLEGAQGDGAMHRLPPAAKLLALFGLSVLLFVSDSPVLLGGIAGLVLAGSLLFCRAALVQWLKSWPLLLTIAVVVLWTAYADSPRAALVVLLRLGALSLFATAVTVTTSAGQFIDTITALARPLERLGLCDARDIGLAIGLVIRFVPEVHARYRAVADAHRARGLKLRVSTVVVPMVIGVIRSADEIADAIDARSIRSKETE